MNRARVGGVGESESEIEGLRDKMNGKRRRMGLAAGFENQDKKNRK